MSTTMSFEDEIKSLKGFDCLSSIDGSVIFELKLDEDEVLDQMVEEIQDPYEVMEQMLRSVPKEVKHPCPGMKFIEYRKEMTKISETIYKKIIKEGTGAVVDLERMSVTYDFALFLESSSLPFDSSVLNGKLGLVSVKDDIEPMPACYMALATMKGNEEAVFWLSSNIAFGPVGCPPKIPPNADILFQASLTSVTVANEGKSRSEKRIESFHKLTKRASKEYLLAKESFKQQNFRHSIDIYLKWIKKLEDFAVANEIDDDKRNDLLVKMYQSVSVCYNRIGKPEKTCLMMREVEKLTTIQSNPKALFVKGRANMMLKNYDHARRCFKKAQRLDPDDEKINGILRQLEDEVELNKVYELEAGERLRMFKSEALVMREEVDQEAYEKRQRDEELQIELEELKSELVNMIATMKTENIEYHRINAELPTAQHVQLTEEVCQQYGVEFKGFQIADTIYNYIYRKR